MKSMSSINPDFMKNAAPLFVCILITIGFFSCLYILAFVPIPSDNKDIFNTLTGGLGVSWAKSVGFWFDSSASSKAKDETLSDIAKKAPAAAAALAAAVPTDNIPAKDVNVVAEGDVTVEKAKASKNAV